MLRLGKRLKNAQLLSRRNVEIALSPLRQTPLWYPVVNANIFKTMSNTYIFGSEVMYYYSMYHTLSLSCHNLHSAI